MSQPISLYLKKIDTTVSFQKVTNKEWFDMQGSYAPIFEDWDFIMILENNYYSEKEFDLAKIYTVLFTLFGPHNNYDDYKCSFAYRFKLRIERKGKIYDYALTLMDVKGSMPYFTYYRTPREGENANAYQESIDAQFSQEDMRSCTLSFLSFLRGFLLIYQPYFNQVFYRINPADYLIYGFKDGAFFKNNFPGQTDEDYENFQKKIKEFKSNKQLQNPMSKPFWKKEELENRMEISL